MVVGSWSHLSIGVVERVLGHEFTESTGSSSFNSKISTIKAGKNSKTKVKPDNFSDTLVAHLEGLVARRMDKETRPSVELIGRLGPPVVKFDIACHVGSFVVSSDRLGLSSQSNFGTIRANICVFKGKWMYEVQLGMKGIMQVGWSTIDSKFSNEKGVGDSSESYGFDGSRNRKWNVTSTPYGETWNSGDIIGCSIDMDSGSIEFYRNGISMGVAFTNIIKGGGIAYFPAVSLAFGENIVANFGGTPLQYPIQGLSPLQTTRTVESARADILLSWLQTLLAIPKGTPLMANNEVSKDFLTVLVLKNKILHLLAIEFKKPSVIEQSLVPFYAKFVGLPSLVSHEADLTSARFDQTKANLLLNVFWTFFDEIEMKQLLERFTNILVNYYKANTLSINYTFQHYAVRLMITLSGHRRTRRALLHQLLVDKANRLMYFLQVRAVDEIVLKTLIPISYWEGKVFSNKEEETRVKKNYEQTITHIGEKVRELENMQIILLKILLVNDDGTETRPSSRAIFLKKFRAHVRNIIRPGSLTQGPAHKSMCGFFRILQLTAFLYSEEVEQNSDFSLPNLNPAHFWDTTLNYFDLERIGGLPNFLYKTHHLEVSHMMNIPDYYTPPTHTQETPFESLLTFTLGNGVGPPIITQTNPPGSTNHTVSTPALPTQPVVVNSQPSDESSIARDAETATETESRGFQSHIPTPAISLTRRSRRGSRNNSLERQESVNNEVVQSTTRTSSGEDVSIRGRGSLLGGSLIAGTPSGQNMMLPMISDFTPIMSSAEARLTFFIPGNLWGFPSFATHHVIQPVNPRLSELGRETGSMRVEESLQELIDDAVILSTAGVAQHIERVIFLRTSVDEYKEALTITEHKLQKAIPPLQRECLEKSVEIFAAKLEELSRTMAWVKGAVFTKERQKLGFSLFKKMLSVLKRSSQAGELYLFVPEMYMVAYVHLHWFLTTKLHPTVDMSTLPGIDAILIESAEFIALNFADTRPIIAETKDLITQTLSKFICDRQMLTALESMSEESQVIMMRGIVKPFENRAWAQNNWMLVRIWQGNGFAFQWLNSVSARKSFRARIQDDLGISNNIPPTPSAILQRHLTRILLEDPKSASYFVHSVLNQLNWSFSEFIGLIQEIQAASNRPERVYMESRQLKVCSTCFELAQSLLRVIEMILNRAPSLLLDFTNGGSQGLFERLAMLLSQILNRTGSYYGTFAQILELDIPGMEHMTHYPLMSAVSGILVASLASELDKTNTVDVPITKIIINEPSFDVTSLDFLIDQNQIVKSGKEHFNLRNYVPDDITEREMTKLDQTIAHLRSWAQRIGAETASISDDEICTICYASPQSVTFKPCNHRTCKSCIAHHLLNKGECFFCKRTIMVVIGDDGTVIHDANRVRAARERESANDDQNVDIL